MPLISIKGKKGGLMMDIGVYRCDKASTVKCK